MHLNCSTRLSYESLGCTLVSTPLPGKFRAQTSCQVPATTKRFWCALTLPLLWRPHFENYMSHAWHVGLHLAGQVLWKHAAESSRSIEVPTGEPLLPVLGRIIHETAMHKSGFLAKEVRPKRSTADINSMANRSHGWAQGCGLKKRKLAVKLHGEGLGVRRGVSCCIVHTITNIARVQC